MSSVNHSLKELRELAPALNKTADEANKTVQEIETLITKELNLGIEAEVAIRSNEMPNGKTKLVSLAHRRINGKFRIAVIIEIGKDDNWDLVSDTPWAECNRETKLESFPSMPSLLEVLIHNIKKAKAKAEIAQQTLKEILASEPAEPTGVEFIRQMNPLK